MNILLSIYQAFSFLWNFRRYVKLRRIERVVKQKVADQRVDKIIYMDIIAKDIRKALRIDANSKYIPDDIKNREEIKAIVEVRHGEKMKLLNITITDDLKLV